MAIASKIIATALGGINEGVPPPKKIEDTLRPGVRVAVYWSSVTSASAKLAVSTTSCRT
jgi:hypothetical protein